MSWLWSSPRECESTLRVVGSHLYHSTRNTEHHTYSVYVNGGRNRISGGLEFLSHYPSIHYDTTAQRTVTYGVVIVSIEMKGPIKMTDSK